MKVPPAYTQEIKLLGKTIKQDDKSEIAGVILDFSSLALKSLGAGKEEDCQSCGYLNRARCPVLLHKIIH